MLSAHPFAVWGPDHLAVLILTGAAALGFVLTRDQLRLRDDRRGRRLVAAGLFVSELTAWLVAASEGRVRVPLQLCDLVLGLTVWALWSLRPTVCELAYFWGLAGSLEAVLTPDLARGFPDPWWLKFFVTHCGIVLSAVYLAATGRVVVSSRTPWRIWAITNGYAAAAGLLNWRFGTNLGYLVQKPSQPSLLDYFGPWPWYIAGMELAALASFYLYYLPLAMRKAHAQTGARLLQ